MLTTFMYNGSNNERKQLSIIPGQELMHRQRLGYEKFRSKAKLIRSGSNEAEVKNIGKKMENAVSAFLTVKRRSN